MQENHPTQGVTENHFNENLCVNCQVNSYEPGYNINLCSDCRKSLIKYPIPKWIRFFGIGILVVVIISLVRTQKYISAAVHLGKAENAIDQKHFVTAQRELSLVLNQFPEHFNANAYMMVASAYNFDFETYQIAFGKVADVKTEDEDLLNTVNAASEYIVQFFPKDTLMYKRIVAVAQDKGKLLAILDSTDEIALKTHIANFLFEKKDYARVDSIINKVLEVDPNFYQALSLKTAVRRNTARYDEALALCDRLLAFNAENIYAISQKARIELKRKHDKEAAVFASKALALDPNDDSAIEAMAMVDYFAGRKKESLASLAKIRAHETESGDSTISKRLSPIILGSEVYR
ncbi:tetratricopeptide repeat protein [Pedobacter vanadiisoli]|uniref:Tetratricopeptide repeat protein n=1 Tax=Pedobacter vanadiisoli TaxID=1761975 RepID=A0ABW5MCJ1_9SPHI